jgi:hypothetical protein
LRTYRIDISIWEIYMKVIVPDIYQLEKGITLFRHGAPTRFIGTVHVVVGDNKELCLLGGLHGKLVFYVNSDANYQGREKLFSAELRCFTVKMRLDTGKK